MNWESFTAALTWCVTVLAFNIAWGVLIMLDVYSTPKQRKNTLIVSAICVIISVLGIATIVGMRWIA
jgi:hypothetical protein